MSHNDQKIIKVLFEEINRIDEKYPGYKNDLKHLLADILNLEREHIISKINIVQKISDQVNKVGMELYRNRKDDLEIYNENE